MEILKDEPLDFRGQWMTRDVRVEHPDALTGIAVYQAQDGSAAEYPVYREAVGEYWYLNDRVYRKPSLAVPTRQSGFEFIDLYDHWDIASQSWKHLEFPGRTEAEKLGIE